MWWTDAGVHQNLTFPPQPDPVSGSHCWLQRVRVEPAHANDAYGDVAVDTGESMAVYREWLAKARPRSRAGRAAPAPVVRASRQARGDRLPLRAATMTVIGSTVDLVDQAARRARLAALLGRLFVSEPGPDLAPLVDGVDELAPLASGDGALAADYERLLLREVPVYESAFLGDDGQRGGPISAAVAAVYANGRLRRDRSVARRRP